MSTTAIQPALTSEPTTQLAPSVAPLADAAEAAPALERPVSRIGRALAVVPSVRPAQKAWRKLGFSLTDPFDFMGCSAFDLVLAGCAVRFLVAAKQAQPNALTAAIGDQLERGSGLLGWTWACQSVHRSREIIESCSGAAFAGENGRKSIVVPRKVSPLATTLLEPLGYEHVPRHPNAVKWLDHIVVMTSNVELAASKYEQAFGLKARRTTMKERRYAFLKVGEVGGSVLELVGPIQASPGIVLGHPWGLAFRSEDLEATACHLRAAGLTAEPRPAVQGGRIVSLPMQIGGIQIAFLGD